MGGRARARAAGPSRSCARTSRRASSASKTSQCFALLLVAGARRPARARGGGAGGAIYPRASQLSLREEGAVLARASRDVHSYSISSLRHQADAGTPTPAAVHRGEVFTRLGLRPTRQGTQSAFVVQRTGVFGLDLFRDRTTLSLLRSRAAPQAGAGAGEQKADASPRRTGAAVPKADPAGPGLCPLVPATHAVRGRNTRVGPPMERRQVKHASAWVAHRPEVARQLVLSPELGPISRRRASAQLPVRGHHTASFFAGLAIARGCAAPRSASRGRGGSGRS